MIAGERALQVILAMLILVGALLLSIAQRTPTMIGLSTVVVLGTVILVDVKKMVAFHPILVNVLAFAVSILTISQFSGGDANSKLNAVANLLTYLQLVLLLQKKNARLYWQVMMLSLLQVVVAAVLHLDFSAGIAFVIYMALTVIAMVHLNRYRHERALFEAAERSEKRIEQIRNGEKHQQISLVFRETRTNRRKSYVWHSLLLAIVGLLFALIVFFSIPRFDSPWYGTKNNPTQITGFSPVVRFGDEGFLKESNSPVMRVSFINDESESIRLAIEPYFRGLTLENYLKVDGEWTWTSDDLRIRGYTDGGDRLDLVNDRLSPDVNWMRQRVRLEQVAQFRPIQENESHILFSVYPLFQSSNSPDDLIFDRRSRLFFRDSVVTNQSSNGPYKFETLTPMYRNLGQLPATPYQRSESERYNPAEFTRNLFGEYFPQFDSEWKSIRELSTEVVASVLDKTDRRLVCEALVGCLKKEDFKYSRALNAIERNASRDPILDFLFHHKTGHCEYFATALALLLRSQGIECRLVSGFRGGDYNEIGGFYEVKEKHAHTWVEARMRPIDCKDSDMISTGQANADGAWLRLDATPSSDFGNAEYSGRNLLDQAGDAIGFLEKLWDDYVLGLDGESRKANGFDPTDESKSWFNGVGLREKIEKWIASMRKMHWSVYASGICIVVLLLLLTGYVRVRRKLRESHSRISSLELLTRIALESLNVLKTFVSPKSLMFIARRQAKTKIDFYDRFEKLMKKHHFDRVKNQTQREFGEMIVGSLSQDISAEALEEIENLIGFIIVSFYKVRFYTATMDEDLITQLDGKMSKLDGLLKQAGR